MPNQSLAIESTDLEPVISDLIADIPPVIFHALHATGSYNKVIGYAAECHLSETIPADYYEALWSDPLKLEPSDFAKIEAIVGDHEAGEIRLAKISIGAVRVNLLADFRRNPQAAS